MIHPQPSAAATAVTHTPAQPEPWLRGTLTEVPPVARAVLHALQLAQEDIAHWCGSLTTEELHATPFGLTPVAFHIRHIGRSLDRLLTYAEGHQLSVPQKAALNVELEPGADASLIFQEFSMAKRPSCAFMPSPPLTRGRSAAWAARRCPPPSAAFWCIAPITRSATPARPSPPPSCCLPCERPNPHTPESSRAAQ